MGAFMVTEKNKKLEQIISQIRSDIFDKKYVKNQKLPTLIELAAQYGASLSTLRRAVEKLGDEGVVRSSRGSGVFVSGFENARTKIKHLSRTVAVVFTLPNTSTGWWEMFNVVTSALGDAGYEIVIYNNGGTNSYEKERCNLNQVYQSSPAGMIYIPDFVLDITECLYKFKLSDIPMVIIDKEIGGIDLNFIASDNAEGGYIAAKHLLNRGHKKIAFASNILLNRASSARDRFFGYCRALQESGIEIEDRFIKTGYCRETYFDDVTYYNAQKEIISCFRDNQATGIVAINDYEAIRLMKAIEELHLSVPEDFSIVGFDNQNVCDHLKVPLTTIAQDFKEIGAAVAETLLGLMNKKHPKEKQLLVPVKLVERESVKKL
jgi:DNA-binding LacI/PurR family transcriptional regulator